MENLIGKQVMKISCKISYSVMLFIERQGTGLDLFFENFETPVEVLRDPSCWIPLGEMEGFLSEIGDFLKLQRTENYFREVGQNNFKLQGWGVLDSVLKMLETPEEIFFQPGRFLSYFISPAPQLEVEIQEKNEIQFRMSQKLEAPFVFSYLLGTLEGLPQYMGLGVARIHQVGEVCFQILWSKKPKEQSLF